MAIKTQGSTLYALLPVITGGLPTSAREVVKIGCIKDFEGGGNPADQIETTCLNETTRSYMAGLRTPGAATFNIDFDPKNDSHMRLYEAAESDDVNYQNIKFAVAFSDGTAPPTATADSSGEWDFVFPATRTFWQFQGYVSDFPISLQANSVVTTAVSVQRNGRGYLFPKT